MHSNYGEDNYKYEKTSISQFLYDNSAYDCMPKNSYIAAIDKQLSIYDAIQLLIEQNHQQLLMWDSQTIQWNWIFSLADAIRFTLFATRELLQHKGVSKKQQNYTAFQHHSFRKLSQDRIEMCSGYKFDDILSDSKNNEDQMIEELPDKQFKILDYSLTETERAKLINQMKKVTLFQFMNEVYDLKSFELKTVSLDTKLSFIILKMLSEKIHRIIVHEKSSKMFTSILNYKDILLFLLRSVNEEFTNTSEYNIQIGSIIQGMKSRENTVNIKQNVWTAFDTMINKNKAVWLNVVDDNNCYITTIFRQDFIFILTGWQINLVCKLLKQLRLTLSQFLDLINKIKEKEKSVPDFQMFKVTETIKEIVEKIVMCKRNTLICIDENRKILCTLGLSELFRLYIQ